MANSFKDTTVSGNFTVTGGIIDGDNDDSIMDRINNNYNRLKTMFCDDSGLEVTLENSDPWTVDSANAYLVGNILMVSFKASRSTAPSGNIAAELMGKVIVNDGGKISTSYATALCNSGTGHLMTGYANTVNDDTTTTVRFYFSGTRDSSGYKQFTTLVHLPVVLNPEYFE